MTTTETQLGHAAPKSEAEISFQAIENYLRFQEALLNEELKELKAMNSDLTVGNCEVCQQADRITAKLIYIRELLRRHHNGI